MDHLDSLEAESIYVLREAYAKFDKLAILWSLGKDSNVVLWLTRKAFFGHVPLPVLHVDTGKKFKADVRLPRALQQGMGPEAAGRALPADRPDGPEPAAGRALGGAQDRRASTARSHATAFRA